MFSESRQLEFREPNLFFSFFLSGRELRVCILSLGDKKVRTAKSRI